MCLTVNTVINRYAGYIKTVLQASVIYLWGIENFVLGLIFF